MTVLAGPPPKGLESGESTQQLSEVLAEILNHQAFNVASSTESPAVFRSGVEQDGTSYSIDLVEGDRGTWVLRSPSAVQGDAMVTINSDGSIDGDSHSVQLYDYAGTKVPVQVSYEHALHAMRDDFVARSAEIENAPARNLVGEVVLPKLDEL